MEAQHYEESKELSEQISRLHSDAQQKVIMQMCSRVIMGCFSLKTYLPYRRHKTSSTFWFKRIPL